MRSKRVLSLSLILALLIIVPNLSQGQTEQKSIDDNIKALENRDVEIRKAAVVALGKSSDIRAVNPLIKALNDSDAGVRKEAVTALGKAGGAIGMGPITQALQEDDNVKVRIGGCQDPW